MFPYDPTLYYTIISHVLATPKGIIRFGLFMYNVHVQWYFRVIVHVRNTPEYVLSRLREYFVFFSP